MINGLSGEHALEDARACVDMLVMLGRALPLEKWSFGAAQAQLAQAQRKHLESLF
jgi:hypothetical protein